MHDISVQDIDGQLHVEQHVELDERMTLKDAHDQVTELEADMRRDVPEIARHPHAHRERARDHRETGRGGRRRGTRASPESGGLAVSRRSSTCTTSFSSACAAASMSRATARCPTSLSLARVHDIQTELEIRFKQDAPELFRVLIHPEPSTDNRR